MNHMVNMTIVQRSVLDWSLCHYISWNCALKSWKEMFGLSMKKCW